MSSRSRHPRISRATRRILADKRMRTSYESQTSTSSCLRCWTCSDPLAHTGRYHHWRGACRSRIVAIAKAQFRSSASGERRGVEGEVVAPVSVPVGGVVAAGPDVHVDPQGGREGLVGRVEGVNVAAVEP